MAEVAVPCRLTPWRWKVKKWRGKAESWVFELKTGIGRLLRGKVGVT